MRAHHDITIFWPMAAREKSFHAKHGRVFLPIGQRESIILRCHCSFQLAAVGRKSLVCMYIYITIYYFGERAFQRLLYRRKLGRAVGRSWKA